MRSRALAARAGRRSPTAIGALGFVQLDPIRAPARAADLILRQRVAGYRAGDLDRAYPELPLAEDYRARLRRDAARASQRCCIRATRARLARRARASAAGGAHPRPCARARRDASARPRARSGARQRSATAGAASRRRRRACSRRCSTAASCAWRGARTASSVYALAPPRPRPRARRAARARATSCALLLRSLRAAARARRLRQLARMVDGQLAVRRRCARARSTRMRDAPRRSPRRRSTACAWLLPADETMRDEATTSACALLAPFDPVVWDRRRFEAFWGWDYRLRGVHAAREAQASATTRCRCSGATTWSAGPTRRSTTARCASTSGFAQARAARRRVPARARRRARALARFRRRRDRVDAPLSAR